MSPPEQAEMPENGAKKAETAPPHVQLIQMSTAYWVSCIVFVTRRCT